MKNNEIKQKIIDVAKNLLSENGTFTIKDIADTCYINIAAVNYYFGTKDILLDIVTKDAIDELKEGIVEIMMRHQANENKRIILEEVIGYAYNYAVTNIGIVSYLFLSKESQNGASNILLDTFFSENEFTKLIYQQVGMASNLKDVEKIKARYMILFSSFAMPLFISISQNKNKMNKEVMLNDENFRKNYIEELLSVVEREG